MRKTFFASLVLVGALSGCTLFDDSTDSAPALAGVITGLPANLPIDAAAACTRSEDEHYVTVRFDNGDSANYQVSAAGVSQMFMLSKEKYQKTDLSDRPQGCFSDYGYDYLLTKSFTGELRVYVSNDIVFNQPLGPEEKSRLTSFAQAVTVAISDHAKFVPPENSWR